MSWIIDYFAWRGVRHMLHDPHVDPNPADIHARVEGLRASNPRAMWYYQQRRNARARSATRRARRHMNDRPYIDMIVWGKVDQDAYLLAGWHPIKEEVDQGYTRMTLRLPA